VTLDDGSPAGQTRTGPAGQTTKPERTDEAGAAATHIPEPASTPAGGLADSGINAQPRTPTRRAGSPDLDRAPDPSVTEPEQARRDARDELPATAGSQPFQPAGQDQFPGGEGMSRPFVYETPGRPEGGAATRRRQAGQVRLRRYLVTEVVTETEAGQRHEVRVQREPVADAEVDAVLTAPDRQGEPAGQEPNEPGHHDWFSDESDPRH
jgi:hypothetical protein